MAALGRYLCGDGDGGGRADAGARREEAAARRARLGEARRPRMPAEPRRPAALPSEPAREARRRRPHSLDAGLVPDRGRDEAQRGEPRGGEGRGAHRNLGRVPAAAVCHGRARRRVPRRRGSRGGARWSVRVGLRAREAGGEQQTVQETVLRHRWRVNAENELEGVLFCCAVQSLRARPARKGLRGGGAVGSGRLRAVAFSMVDCVGRHSMPISMRGHSMQLLSPHQIGPRDFDERVLVVAEARHPTQFASVRRRDGLAVRSRGPARRGVKRIPTTSTPSSRRTTTTSSSS